MGREGFMSVRRPGMGSGWVYGGAPEALAIFYRKDDSMDDVSMGREEFARGLIDKLKVR